MLGLIIASLVLAYSSVEAKDKISVSQWVSRSCSGHLSGKQLDIKQGDCKNINAQSLALHTPGKYRHLKGWLERVNTGQDLCWATLYSQGGCHADDPGAQTLSVPLEFEKCWEFPESVRSIKFHCERKEHASSFTRVAEVEHTSYSIAPQDRVPTPIPVSTYATYTAASVPSPTAVSGSAQAGFEPRADAAKHNFKHVWYKHPWGGQAICFECWLRHKNNKDKFQCESSEKALDCAQPAPDRNFLTQTVVVTPAPVTTTTTIVPVVFTVAGQTLEERRERLIVGITHPFFSDRVTCAKATWKHPGKHSQKVTFKGPHKCKGGDFSVDVARPTYVTTQVLPTPTTTAIATDVALSVVQEVATVTMTVFR